MKPTSGRLFARLIRLGRQDDAEFLANIVKARNTVANDNVPITEGIGVDSEMVMRPTIEEVRRAAITVKDGKPDPEGVIGLRFDAKGRLTEYRAAAEDGTPILNKEGEEFWLKPKDGYKKPKGSRRKTSKALAAGNNAHGTWLMSLRGIGKMPPAWVPDTRYPSACHVLVRLTAAAVGYVVPSKLRDLLASHGVDGTRTLEQCAEANPQANVTLCKPGMAWKVDFLCGKPDANAMATEGSFVGAPDAAEMSMIAAIDANGHAVPDVLDMALAGMTMREIATAKNWGNTKQAERKAVLEVDAAIAELRRAA
jgi:hypothetical protein